MKNLLQILTVLFVLGIYSCACDGIECGLGICEDGTCICPEGVEGNNCETITNSKYYGKYQIVTADCGTTNGTSIQNIEINAHSNTNPTEIMILVRTTTDSSTISGTIINEKLLAEGKFGPPTITFNGIYLDDDSFDTVVNWAGLSCDIRFMK